MYVLLPVVTKSHVPKKSRHDVRLPKFINDGGRKFESRSASARRPSLNFGDTDGSKTYRTQPENGGGKGRCVGERERGKRRREKERGGRFPD